MNQTSAILLAVALLFASTGAPARAASLEQSANLLVNPGFEGLYTKQCCENTTQFQANTPIERVQVAYGWTAWWIEPGDSYPNQCSGCTPYSRPEYRYSTLIHSGSSSQQYFTTYSIHEAGLYQRVSGVAPGQKLRFSAHILAYSSKDNPWQIRVGIDPGGGVNPYASSVVWGPSYSFSNGAWILYSAEAVAQSSTITVFTYTRPSWAFESNSVYVDDASLTVVGESAPGTGGPTSSACVLSSSSSGSVVSPCDTTTAASAAGGATYTVQRGDTLYRISRKYGTTVEAIKAANGLTSDIIKVGQVLIIPGK